MFLLVLAFAGIFTVFFSSAYFLYRSYFVRESSFFSYSEKISGFCEISPEDLSGIAGCDVRQKELTIKGSGGVTLKGDLFARCAESYDISCVCNNAGGCTEAAKSGFAESVKSKKLVVIVPGYGDSVKTVYAPAAEYIKRGFDVLIVYPRGVGKSGGKYCGLSCVDAKDLVHWLKDISKLFDKAQVDDEAQSKTEIILHGFSFGASAVIQCVSSRAFYKAKLNEYVLKAIADSAFTSMRDVFSDYYNHFTQKSRFQRFFFMRILNYMSLVSFLAGKSFFCNISPMKILKRRERLFAKREKNKTDNPDTASKSVFKRSRRSSLKNTRFSFVAKFRRNRGTACCSEQTACGSEDIKSSVIIQGIPILFVHGKKDTICRFEMAEKLFAISGAAEKGNRIVLFDEAAHGGSFYINAGKYMEAVLSF